MAAALAASLVSLLHRYRRKGHPFASRQTTGWALAVIAVTTAVATGVGLGLPEVVDAVPPATVGVLIPTLLCAARAGKSEPSAERSVWYQIATVGVILLLDQLEQQMLDVRESWCEARVSRTWDLNQLDAAIWQVHANVAHRVSDRARQTRLRSDFEAACEAVKDAENVVGLPAAARARHTAEQALITMLGRAWDWGCTSGIPQVVLDHSAGGAACASAKAKRTASEGLFSARSTWK